MSYRGKCGEGKALRKGRKCLISRDRRKIQEIGRTCSEIRSLASRYAIPPLSIFPGSVVVVVDDDERLYAFVGPVVLKVWLGGHEECVK